MAVKIQEILTCLDLQAPFDLAETWDNVGLLVGNSSQEVTGILAGLDPTNVLLDEALEKNCNTIITHHPVIFKPLTSINTGIPEGRLLAKALSHNIAIIGCHTNFDSASEGVSDYLANQLGLGNLTPLIKSDSENPSTGIGRIGNYESPLPGSLFLERLLTALRLSGVQATYPIPEKVSNVAICGGSGSDFAAIAHKLGVDVYVSAEIKHATAIWAKENNFCVIDGTHYATEKPAITLLVQKLQQYGKKRGWTFAIQQSEKECHPFTYIEKI